VIKGIKDLGFEKGGLKGHSYRLKKHSTVKEQLGRKQDNKHTGSA
jgi:hypothetical protein